MQALPKVGILSLGCPRNIVDSENILGRLALKGYRIVDIPRADIAILNTCAFIEDAKKESINAILDLIRLKRDGKIKKIIVYGCLPQRYKEELAGELPEIDAFLGRVSLNNSPDSYRITAKHYAYLKICEGCINNCSFCVIPSIKGRFASIDMDSAVARASELACSGVSELNIIGQDISGYGFDLYRKFKLSELLEKIIKASKGIGWIRLLYLYPSRISDRLLDIISSEARVCKYLDLPIQHASNRILRLMRRKTTKDELLGVIERIRSKVKGAAIRTSLIVGFPSETDKEFKELLSFIKDVRFERLGVFIYSREEGTAAYNFNKQIPQKVKEERFNEIMSFQQQISSEVNSKFIGKTLKVLVDEKEGGSYLGRTEYDAPEVDGTVYLRSKRKLNPGDFVKARITDTLEYDLAGEALEHR